MKGRSNPFVAREGSPFLVAVIVTMAIGWYQGGIAWALWQVPLLLLLLVIFRDPLRATPAIPLGVVSPVDGRVAEVSLTGQGALGGEAHRIVIRVSMLGTYTARSPVEGKIMDVLAHGAEPVRVTGFSGLWVQTDEHDDVVLQFHGYRLGLAPLAFIGYGERVGQGQRCAYLRLTRLAEVQLPINSRVLVAPGQRVMAGTDVLAKLPHP